MRRRDFMLVGGTALHGRSEPVPMNWT